MRVVDKVSRIGRRDFLKTTAGAAALAAVVPTLSAEALAEPLKTVAAEEAPTLVLVARDLYPHDRLPDEAYRKAVATIDAAVADDAAGKSVLADGITHLNATAMSLKGKAYSELTQEADRVAVLNAIADTPFFAKMRSSMVTALYNQPEIWIKLGYEGPSFEKGGYINRGFNDLDWL